MMIQYLQAIILFEVALLIYLAGYVNGRKKN